MTRAVNYRYRVGEPQSIRVLERSNSGRVKSVEIVGDRDRVRVTGELRVRQVFGGLNSTFFVFSSQRDADGRLTAVVFRGAGFGHGVGMCQTGARSMAAQGYGCREILQHYYAGVDVIPPTFGPAPARLLSSVPN